MHKAEGLVNLIVHNGQIELVVFANTFPVFDTGPAQRIDTQRQARFLDRRHVDDVRQPFNERLHQILFFNVTRSQRRVQRNAFHALQAGGQQFVGAVLHHFGDVGISRAAVWRVVLDTTIFRRVV